MQYALIYVVGCLLVALLGTNRKLGFWGYLFFSLLLTPLVGLITVLASDTHRVGKGWRLSLPGAAGSSEGSDEATRTYMTRIDQLVASRRITRDYASRQLVPLLVRDAHSAARSGIDGKAACPLETILLALEALPPPAGASAPIGPPAP
jgi:hypothetical protein